MCAARSLGGGYPAAIGQVVRAGAAYFALVFGVGFILGAIRVPLLVPRLGERWAELTEMPIMGVAIVLAAGHVVRRFSLPSDAPTRLLTGGLAWVLLVAAELGLAVLLQDRSLADYIASRDPVSGAVYLVMLGFFALAPWVVPTVQRRLSGATESRT